MSSARILELRVHGVRNTPPNELLCVEAEEVVPAEANGIKLVDNLAGFYRVKNPPSDSSTTLEAYSWGKLSRFAPAGLIGKTSRAFYNIGWFLIAPFGFANAAYWARVLKADDRRQDGVDPGTGAALVRLFSLLLTLLLASSVATAAMDLVAVQCFRKEGNTHQICTHLPHWFDGLRDLTRGQRLAAVSPFPIAAVALLALISLSSSVRFRTRIQDQLPPHPGVPGRRHRKEQENTLKDSFVLAAPRLWIRRSNSPTGVLHIAATVQLVSILLAADLRSTSTGDIRNDAAGVFVLCCALLAGTVAVVMDWGRISVRSPSQDELSSGDETPSKASGSRMTSALVILLLSIVLYLVAVVFACIVHRAGAAINEAAPFTAAHLVPTMLVALLAILATSGCFMRLGRTAAYLAGALWCAVGVTGLGIVVATWSGAPVLVSAAFGLCALCVVAVGLALLNQGERTPVRPLGRKAEAWYGMGPGVLMFLSLLLAAFYSSALVVGVGNWLQSGALLWQQNKDHPLFRDLQEDTYEIRVPFLYWAAGGVMVLFVLAALLILAALMLLSQRKEQWITDPNVQDGQRYEREILAVRRRSALLQRGEPVVMVAAVATLVGVIVVLALTILHGHGEGHRWLQNQWLWHMATPAATWVATSTLTAAGLLIVAASVAGAVKGEGRPLGLLWDLVAWLPRAGHPFGPACYSERAVPELADRMVQWLTDENDQAIRPEERRILLATHSLGSVLGIAALYQLAAMGKGDLLPKIRLLTFGVQLRPYFGRFFPDLWGPSVLGTSGTRGPKAFKSDPWKGRDLPMPSPLTTSGHDGESIDWAGRQLTNLMKAQDDSENTTVWLNIWRRTDYLGFPVKSYVVSELDQVALELEPDSYQALVATHSNYFRTRKYDEAKVQLLQNW